MLRAIPLLGLLALLSVLGCNRAALPIGDAGAATDLAAGGDLRLVDFAGADLADPCALSAPNATVVLDGRSLGYAWSGNVDRGGEANCGGPPEGVDVVLGADGRIGDDPYRLTRFGLPLPLVSGPQTVTVFTTIGGMRQAFGTVTITGSTPLGAGPGLATIEGDIEAPGLGMKGHFSAVHCAALDIICI